MTSVFYYSRFAWFAGPVLLRLHGPLYGLKGFTLTELLIALVILGEIANFTIPKLLNSQQNARKATAAKEFVGTVSAAYQAYQQAGNVPDANTSLASLTPYMNYVKIVSDNSKIDGDSANGTGGFTCSNGNPCIALHSGARAYLSGYAFGGTGSTNGFVYLFDPNGTYDTTTDSCWYGLYYNGRITDHGGYTPPIVTNSGAIAADSTRVPPWMKW